jgi:hypothetical protein
LDDSYTFLVRGPSSTFPRGYAWLIPAWYVILSGGVVLAARRLSGTLTLWLLATEVGGLLIAAVVAWCALVTARHRAFYADRDGIWLGVSTRKKRPKQRQVHVGWAEIEQLRVVPRRYGALVEIRLGPAAHIVLRPGLARQAVRLMGSLIMPFGYGRGRPALTSPRSDPPRYLIKLCDVTATELRQALAGLMPPGGQVRVLPKPRALRLSSPPKRQGQPEPAGTRS